MDDDQAFVEGIVRAITNHDAVDYDTVKIDYTDEGRDAVVEATLFAGDRYRVTFTEIHD